MKTLLFLILLGGVIGLTLDDKQQRAQLIEAQDTVSQLKSQAILRLRTYMQKRWPIEKGA